MKKPLVNHIAEKKGILIPLALIPAGLSVFMSVQPDKAEQAPKTHQPEPPVQTQIATAIANPVEPSIKGNETRHERENTTREKSTNSPINKQPNEANTKITTPVQEKKLVADSQSNSWSVDTYDDNNMLLSSFSIEIEHISHENIKGNYCYISNYGRKEDCLNEFSGIALNTKNKSSAYPQYLINFHSSFKNLAGKATLDFGDKEITWDLKEFPADLGVGIPKHAILTKENYQLTQQ